MKRILLCAALLLAACGQPDEDVTLETPRTVPAEAPSEEPLAIGTTYADVDTLVAAAAPMAPDIEVEAREQNDGEMRITILASGYEDDSLAAERFEIEADSGPDGLTVTGLEKSHRCYRGETEDWTTELCP
ncbi:hypothetical protein [Parvularcula dongshanensis]|uniref:Lipoprotein n=1 Tax=Parvularcula dongshanensis TaxID=1173995 RepID=A0A840I0D7_9PROT|nr:hypothetical protein [Parvularcula dongshanensis]MBB4657638.1 hypothetical protein [Parvularcula dongshanensis]